MTQLLALVGGLLADGTGGPLRPGNLLILDGKIAEVGTPALPAGVQVMECSGCIVAPGFIDAHSHSDLQVLDGRKEKLLQGVTAEVVGNCGFSPYPRGKDAKALHEFANGIFCKDDDWGWRSASAYLAELRAHASLASVYSLIGHGSLRIAIAGNSMQSLSESDVTAMERLLDDALVQGAIGFSTGLMYAPGSSAPTSELERLCSIVAKHGRIYCTHMRDYGFHLLEAIDEQVDLARKTGCRLQISHLQAVGKANRDLNERALERIEEAHVSGVDIAFDCYPYTAGSTVMTQMLPQSALEGGTEKLLLRLSTPEERIRIAEEMLAGLAHSWSELLISAVASDVNAYAVGKTIEELSALRNQSPVDVVFDLLLEEKTAVNILEFNQSEENLRRNLNHPLSLIISDGFYVKGRPHPRLHGTFPELLGTICRDRGWMNVPTAIHKITGFPAERFRLLNCGYLRPGYAADITVFDPKRICSRATYDEPERSPQGLRFVLRDGRRLL